MEIFAFIISNYKELGGGAIALALGSAFGTKKYIDKVAFNIYEKIKDEQKADSDRFELLSKHLEDEVKKMHAELRKHESKILDTSHQIDLNEQQRLIMKNVIDEATKSLKDLEISFAKMLGTLSRNVN